ncbi:phage holin family protein [soil metagenome]
MSDVPQKKRSLFALIGDLPHLLVDLIRGELDSLKQEMLDKIKHAGVGIGLFAAAGVFGFLMVAVLIAAAVLGIATVLPGWLAALIVAGGLLLITLVLVLIGVGNVRRGVQPAPTETIDSVKKDINAIKGIGKRDHA